MTTRKEVYKVIDSERAYQRQVIETERETAEHSVGDFLTMLDRYVRRAQDQWTDHGGDELALHEVRKIVTVQGGWTN